MKKKTKCVIQIGKNEAYYSNHHFDENGHCVNCPLQLIGVLWSEVKDNGGNTPKKEINKMNNK